MEKYQDTFQKNSNGITVCGITDCLQRHHTTLFSFSPLTRAMLLPLCFSSWPISRGSWSFTGVVCLQYSTKSFFVTKIIELDFQNIMQLSEAIPECANYDFYCPLVFYFISFSYPNSVQPFAFCHIFQLIQQPSLSLFLK